ncbi:hypothetical protein [Actinomadura macra]|uniref:hypothetical protein n=1 Tax=Actinomadura macra TaxID=46164 RepID=UPI000B16CBC1|nr:hypothetical protein [Actinomadura macra]
MTFFICAGTLRTFLRTPHPVAYAQLLQTPACEIWLRSRRSLTRTPATGGGR